MLRSLSLAVFAAVAIASTAHAQLSVKIGVLNDRSGFSSAITGEGSVVAAQMAIEDFQAAQKGIQVEIISADHQNKPDVGLSIARRWYDTEGVDVIADVPISSVALAVNQLTRDKNKIALFSGPGASELTGAQCSPNSVMWTYDTWSLAHASGRAVVQQGGDTWFFLAVDYVFGRAVQRDTSEVVTASGGKVLGSVRHPLSTSDFSSYLLQAQASKAKIIGLASAGTDMTTAIKQAAEFGIVRDGQKLAGLVTFITDVHALGTSAAQGLLVTEAFYWDMDEPRRAWSKRFADRYSGKAPTSIHAGVYSSILHYLKAVQALKDKDPAKVMAWMKANPTDDVLFGKGQVRADGRKIHEMYLFEVKKPSESKGDWDLYKLVATIPANEAFRPLNEGGCPLVTD
jgi:branched-chain amino acid transport system substrate-binding protein